MMRTDIDYRLKEHRLEGFDKFYEFHIKTNDCSPDIAVEKWIADDLNFDFEKRCVMALFHGATYAGPCETMFADKFPVFKPDVLPDMIDFFEQNKKRLLFSPDCKYRKMVFPKFLTSVAESIKPYGTLGEVIVAESVFCSSEPSKVRRYTALQQFCMNNWYHWGRMGHWCFSEALDRFAVPLEAPTMEFGAGGKSISEGWAFCIGRDDLVAKLDDDKELTKDEVRLLEESAKKYIDDFSARHGYHKLATFFTLETACCNYKRQHKGSRYGGCYIDEQYDEITYMKTLWPEYEWLWNKYLEGRQAVIPASLLFENFESGKAYMNSWMQALKDWGRIPRVEAYHNNVPQNWIGLEYQPWFGDDIFSR